MVDIKKDLLRFKDIIFRIRELNDKVNNETSIGVRDSLIKERNLLWGKLKHTVAKIQNVLNGTVITITYQDPSGKISKACFTNCDKNLGKFILEMKYSGSIKILEYKIYTTQDLVGLL